MTKYHYFRDHHYSQRHKFVNRTRRFVIVVVLAVLIIAGLVIFDASRQKKLDKPLTSSKGFAVVESPLTVLTSGYFQFQAPKTWVEIANETSENTYVYRSIRNQLVEHELDVYINRPPESVKITRVLPVTIQGDRLQGVGVSDHCRGAFPASNKIFQPQIVTWQSVQFMCARDSADYTVVVGQKNGGSTLHIKRPNGKITDYTIIYKNVKADPDSREIEGIIQTFQIR